jgi:hypothetical protein
MEKRDEFPNISVHFYGSLLDTSRGGEGKLVALSGMGCKIRTANSLHEHTYLRLRIIPGDMDLVVLIELAAVRLVQ